MTDDGPLDPEPPTDGKPEGVRIIGAEEAAEAVTRGDVKPRRGEGEKGFGDRPEAPPPEERPALRFPRSQTGGDPDRFGAIPIIKPGMPPPPEVLQERGNDEAERTPAPFSPDPNASAEPPVVPAAIVSDPPSGEVELPHWTEPPTGQVPAVIVPPGGDDLDAWSSITSVPRWRDAEGDYDAQDTFDDLADDEVRMGALDEDRVGAADELFFDDFDNVEDRTTDMQDSLEPRILRSGRRTVPAAPSEPAAPLEYDDDELYDDELDGPAPPGGRDLPLAIGVGVVMAAIALLCFRWGAVPTLLLSTGIVAFAALEFFNSVRQAGLNPATFFGLAAAVALMLAAYTDGTGAYPIVGALVVMFGLIWYLWVAPGDSPVVNLGVTLLGIGYVGGLGSFVGLMLNMFKDAGGATIDGTGMVVAAVVAAVGYDVGALAAGQLLGHTPLTDASPQKTQEGLAGGVFLSMFATIVVVFFGDVAPFGDSLGDTLLLALAAAVAAPLGDLCESVLKRDLGVKDMGSVLPGHGGVLDRFDAILFVLPTTYFVALVVL